MTCMDEVLIKINLFWETKLVKLTSWHTYGSQANLKLKEATCDCLNPNYEYGDKITRDIGMQVPYSLKPPKMSEISRYIIYFLNLCRVFVQEHAMPEGFGTEDLPYPVSLRFYVAKSFLKSISHQGTTVFLDTRDVFLQKDPFSEFSDGIMHFPRESGAYRLKGPYTWNFKWILNCYGK